MRLCQFQLLSLMLTLPFTVEARVWCENADKTGFWADQCPANMRPAEQAGEWKPVAEPVKERPRIGMTEDEALALAWPWGKPKEINRTQTAGGTREQWVYGYGYAHSYLYFVNGILTTIQD